MKLKLILAILCLFLSSTLWAAEPVQHARLNAAVVGAGVSAAALTQPTFVSNYTQDGNPNNTTTMTISGVTCTGSNKLLLVFTNTATYANVASVVRTSVSETLTHLSGVESGNSTYGISAWYKIAPSATAADATITLSNTDTGYIAAGAICFAGVNQSTPFGTVATRGGYGNASVNVTAIVGELVIGAISSGDAVISSLTHLYKFSNFGVNVDTEYTTATTTTVAVGFTDINWSSLLGFAVKGL